MGQGALALTGRVAQVRALLWSVAALAIGSLFNAASAQILTHDTLMGRWCTTGLTYTFSPSAITVTRTDGQSWVLPVSKIDVTPHMIVVTWRTASPPHEEKSTQFSEFTGSTMVQLANAAGPRRDFRRC